MYLAHHQPQQDLERGSPVLYGMKYSKGLANKPFTTRHSENHNKTSLLRNQTVKNEGRGSTKEWTFPLQKHQRCCTGKKTGLWVFWSWVQQRAKQLKRVSSWHWEICCWWLLTHTIPWADPGHCLGHYWSLYQNYSKDCANCMGNNMPKPRPVPCFCSLSENCGIFLTFWEHFYLKACPADELQGGYRKATTILRCDSDKTFNPLIAHLSIAQLLVRGFVWKGETKGYWQFCFFLKSSSCWASHLADKNVLADAHPQRCRDPGQSVSHHEGGLGLWVLLHVTALHVSALHVSAFLAAKLLWEILS